MKRNEILGEHKKGIKAVKYNKKPKDHAAEFSKAKEKLAPVKPMEGYNPNSAGAEHRRKLDQSHAADLKARAEAPDATERDQQRYQNYLDKKEQMANDYNDRMERESVAQEGHRDYDDNRTGFGDQGKREFKRREMEHELGHETNNYAVAIDGRTWKVFASKNHALAVARSLQNKGKKATVHETGAEPTAEAMGADMGKITKVDPATKKATLTKPDGTSMEVDSTALKPTPDGKMSMDTPDTDELKTGTAVVSSEGMDSPPPTDSSSPISGDEENVDLRRLRELAGQPAAPVADVDPGEQILSVAASPEVKAFIDANTIRDAEGDVDIAGTFGQMITKASAEMDVKGLQAALAQMEVKFKEFPTTPEFQAMSPEEQAEWKQAAPEGMQTLRDMTAQLVKLQQTFAAGGKQMTDLSQDPNAPKDNPMKGVKSLTAPPVEEGTEADKDLSNGFTLTTIEFGKKTVPAVFDSQDNAYWIENNTGLRQYGLASHIRIKDGKADGKMPGTETAAAMKAAGWEMDRPYRQREPRPPADTSDSTPHVPKDYQTREPLKKGPDGTWRNSKGEERDSLHGGPVINGAAMFRSMTPRAPTQESAELTAMLRIAGLR